MKTYTIERRAQRLVNTDPQRRCYNGCHYKSELQWTPWERLVQGVSEETIDEKVAWWVELNNYAVSQRGESSRYEFRKVIE